MNILRAHDYAHVEDVRASLARLPLSWRQDIEYIPWIILPDSLSPLWIGLMRNEMDTHDGRKYSECGGWAASNASYDSNFRQQPHIYLSSGHAWAAVHEAAHILEDAWQVPVNDFYKPWLTLYEYMATNPSEYFACGVDAFLTPERNDERWNCNDLAKADNDLYKYLVHKAEMS